MFERPEQRQRLRLALGILSIFAVLCISNIFHYSPTYDELKFLEIGEELSSGQGWKTEMSVVHAPLSFYTHGLLLKPFEFAGQTERLRWARISMLIYPLALGALVFLWAVEIFGTSGGVLALALYAFNPNILAHSSLITTDIIYACFSLFLLYFFWRFLTEGKALWLSAAGVSLGLALLSKYSAVLWVLLLPGIGVVVLVVEASRTRGMDGGKRAIRPMKLIWGTAAIFALAILVLNVGYGFSGSFMPVGANHYQSRLLAGLSETPWISRLPVPAPYPFMRGFDAQKYISEVGHPSFLAGVRSTTGWWYYYLVGFLLKMPVAFWLILGWAFLVMPREKDAKRGAGELILFSSSLAIVGASSFLSKSQAGFRYVLPSLPPLFILTGAAAAAASTLWKKRALAGMAALYVLPALWIHPHHIAYFSEIAGGPKNGYKWLADSNLDWGQDLGEARRYVRESEVPISVNPGMLPVPGRILINATTLQDCFSTYDVHGWLRAFKPVDYVGYSWLVFDVDEKAVAARTHGNRELPDEYYFAAFEYARDHLQSAERFAEAALSSKTGLPEALYILGISRMGLGKLDEAAGAFRGIPESSAFYVDARSNLSFIAAVRGDAEACKDFWKQSMIEGTLRAYSKRPSLDIEKYSELLATNPDDCKLRNNLAVSLWADGRLAEAQKEMLALVGSEPDFAEALSNLAVVLEERGLYDEALAAQRKHNSDFLLLRSSSFRDYRVYYEDTRVMLGDTLEIYPKPDEDVLRLESHLTEKLDDAATLNQLAVALMKRGRFGEAHRYLGRAVALNPASGALYTNLAVLYTEKKMFSEALEACEHAYEIDPHNSSVAELLSSIRRRLSASEQAGIARIYAKKDLFASGEEP